MEQAESKLLSATHRSRLGTLNAAFRAACEMPDLLREAFGGNNQRRLYVVNTLARHEKALARELCEIGIPNYLPLKPQVTTYRGRTTNSQVPVICGVVFIYANVEERGRASQLRGTASVDDVADQKGLRKDLVRLAQVLANAESATKLDPSDLTIDALQFLRQNTGTKKWAVA